MRAPPSQTRRHDGLHFFKVGLDCKEVSPLAWQVLKTGCNDFVAIGDEVVGPCLKLLANGETPVRRIQSTPFRLSAFPPFRLSRRQARSLDVTLKLPYFPRSLDLRGRISGGGAGCAPRRRTAAGAQREARPRRELACRRGHL